MADGKRYKNDEVKEMGRNEEELQEKYQAMLKEIENRRQKDEIAEKDKEDLFKTNEGIEAIQKIKEEIIESVEELPATEEIVILGKEKVKDLDKEILFEADDISLEEEKETTEIINETEEKNNMEEDVKIEEKEIKKEIKKDKKAPKKQSKASKVFKVIGNIIYYISFIIVLAVLLMVAVQRFSNNEISLGGFRMFNILTGSMEPEYNVGDVLISKAINPEDIEIGDDIVYKGEEKPFKDLIVTHRVVDLNEEDGTYSFITRGLANDVDDPMISESQVYGKIIYKVHIFSVLSKAINNMYVFFFVIFIPIVLLVVIKVIQVKNEKTEDYDEE